MAELSSTKYISLHVVFRIHSLLSLFQVNHLINFFYRQMQFKRYLLFF